jgi:hypothetical protein
VLLLGVAAVISCSGCSSVGFLVNGQLDVQHGLAFGITNLLVRPVMLHLVSAFANRLVR